MALLRRLVPLLLVASLATGCDRSGKLAAGGIMTFTGLVLAAAPNDTETRQGFFGGTYEHEDHTYDIIGGLLLLTGSIVLIGGLLTDDDDDEQKRVVMLYPEPVPYPVAPVAEPSLVVDAPSAQTVIVANEVHVHNAQSATPAAPVLHSKLTNRLAIQASTTARAGQCEAAMLTAHKLAEVDLGMYERLLVTDVAVADCATRSAR